MTIQMINPTGKVQAAAMASGNRLETLHDKKVGFIFNQHSTASAFWKTLESCIEEKYRPASVSRAYKGNTWAPAATADIQKLTRETDYVLVGVGA